MVKNILLCVLGTFGFCAVLNAPKKHIKYILLGAFISAGVYELCEKRLLLGVFSSTLISAVVVEFYSEAVARAIKAPAIVILVPCEIPLLPGGYLFYAVTSVVSGKLDLFFHYASLTACVAFALAMGAVICLIVLAVLRRCKERFTDN